MRIIISHCYSGPSPPIQPREVLATNITAYSATVQWVIPHLTYTQEQYNVSYGTTRGLLDQSSVVMSSSADISASNITYDLSIQDLMPNSVYYFQLRSTNTQGTTTSIIMTFTTLEAGK